jgi:hypothetical protein
VTDWLGGETVGCPPETAKVGGWAAPPLIAPKLDRSNAMSREDCPELNDTDANWFVSGLSAARDLSSLAWMMTPPGRMCREKLAVAWYGLVAQWFSVSVKLAWMKP